MGMKTFFKYSGFLGVVVMAVTSILLFIYGNKLSNNGDIENKVHTGKTFMAFGAMNIFFGIFLLLALLFGCQTLKSIRVSGED